MTDINVATAASLPAAESSLEEESNPWQDIDMIGAMFNYLNLKDIKACRLVCLSWMRCIEPFYDKFLPDESQRYIEVELKCSDGNAMHNSPGISRRYDRSVHFVGDSLRLTSKLLSWNRCVLPDLQNPTLCIRNNICICNFRQLINKDCGLSNLVSLSIENSFPDCRSTCPGTSVSSSKRFPSFEKIQNLTLSSNCPYDVVLEFLKACPSMEELRLTYVKSTATLQAIASLEETQKSKIKILNLSTLHNLPSSEVMRCLIACNLRLTDLDIRNLLIATEGELCEFLKELPKLLEDLSPTIKSLILPVTYEVFTAVAFKLPASTMKNLQVLDIGASMIPIFSNGGNFETVFPSLKTLDFGLNTWSIFDNIQEDDFFPVDSVCVSLTKLTLPRDGRSESLTLIPRCARAFPNLETLNLSTPNVHAVETICKEWPKLKHLMIACDSETINNSGVRYLTKLKSLSVRETSSYRDVYRPIR